MLGSRSWLIACGRLPGLSHVSCRGGLLSKVTLAALADRVGGMGLQGRRKEQGSVALTDQQQGEG